MADENSDDRKEVWPGPAGLIPVTSGRADDANLINRSYLDSLLVETRMIGSVLPNLSTTIFGQEFATPIMMPAFSHLNKVGEGGRMPMEEYAEAAKQLGALNWVGMEPDDVFSDIAAVGAPTVRIIKPFANHDLILSQIASAEEAGAVAVGIDIDHIAGDDGGYDVADGNELGPITVKDLASYVAAAHVPFVAKGVLSVADASQAAEAGCAAVLVSHHHGRTPFAVPPVSQLPAIKSELAGSDVAVFCDCGIDTGYDAYKALALGADAVAVGRGILRPLLKEGADGVVAKVRKMDDELVKMMLSTGIPDTGSFDSSVLHSFTSLAL